MRAITRCAVVGLLAVQGCTGEIDVYLLDASQPAPGGELALSSFAVPLDHVDAQRDGKWEALARGPDPYNLLDFSGEPTEVDLLALRDTPARIAHDELSVGELTALRLVLTPGELFVLTTEEGVTHALSGPTEWEVALTPPMQIGSGPAAERSFDLRVRECVFVDEDGEWWFVPELVPLDE